MNRDTAHAVYLKIEEVGAQDHGVPNRTDQPTQPAYDVRLDAGHDINGDRTFRIRITPGEWGCDEDAWRYILDLAKEHGLAVAIQNSGMELT